MKDYINNTNIILKTKNDYECLYTIHNMLTIYIKDYTQNI